MHRIYISRSINPAFNLALEEYRVQHHALGDRVLYLWQNQNTVVIGRNQNPWKECNLEELKRLNGRLVRRLSGGGAVYHDLGNLNFTFITDYSEERTHENIGLILQALAKSGIPAAFSGKNDILVDGFKVSGNAFFVKNNVLCHHGTLLVDTDFTALSKILTVSRQKLESKGIDSVKSRVKNLTEFNANIRIDGLQEDLADVFKETIGITLSVTLLDESAKDEVVNIGEVLQLQERYESWDWSYGASPEFNIQVSERFPCGEITLYLVVKDGSIEDVNVSTDALNVELPQQIKDLILHTDFDLEEIISRIASLDSVSKAVF